MHLSDVITGQIFYEVAYGNPIKYIAMEDPHLEANADGQKMLVLKALNMETLKEFVLSVHPDYQHYLRLEPEQIFGLRPGFALEWAESNVPS